MRWRRWRDSVPLMRVAVGVVTLAVTGCASASVKKTDRATGVSSSESTNFLNGKRITESLRYDKANEKDVVIGKRAGSVDRAPVFLEEVDAGPMDSE